MFNKLLRFIGNLGYALLFALFGGYLAAAIICMLLSWLLGLIGFNITTSDIIGSYAGAAILAVCCVLFGLEICIVHNFQIFPANTTVHKMLFFIKPYYSGRKQKFLD